MGKGEEERSLNCRGGGWLVEAGKEGDRGEGSARAEQEQEQGSTSEQRGGAWMVIVG